MKDSKKEKKKSSKKLKKLKPTGLNQHNMFQFRTGLEYFQKGQLNRAINEWESIRRQSPNNIDILHNLAVVYLQVKQLSGAEECIKRSLRINSKRSEEWDMLGMVYAMRAASNSGPLDTTLIEESLECFSKALELNPKNKVLLIKIATSHFTLHNLEHAKKNIENYLKYHPNDPKALELRNVIIEESRRFGGLTINCENCGSKVEDFLAFCINCGEALEKKTVTGERVSCLSCGSIISKNVGKCPNCGAPIDKYGVDIHEQGISKDGLISQMNELMEKEGFQHVETAKSYFNAILFLNKGKHSNAIDLMKKATELEPKHSTLYSQLGNMYFGIGKSDLGKQYCEEALKFDPQNSSALEILLSYYTQQGDTEQAEYYFQKTKALGPNYVKELIRQGHIVLGADDTFGAVSLWKKAQRLDPDNIEIELRIKAFEEDYIIEEELAKFNGDLQAAMAHYQRRLRLNPDDPFAKRMTMKISMRQMGGAPAFRYRG